MLMVLQQLLASTLVKKYGETKIRTDLPENVGDDLVRLPRTEADMMIYYYNAR